MERRRHDAVRVLLRTLNDIYPGPEAPKRPDLAGPAPSSRVPCDFCKRTGRVLRDGPVDARGSGARIGPCPVCDGAGWRKRRKGDPEWDEMTGQLVATLETKQKPVPMSPSRIDAEIGRLQALQLAREGHVDPEAQESWERARARRDKDGSYREIERALDLMQIEWPEGRDAVNSMYLVEPAVSYSPAIELACVIWLAARMPHKIRLPKRFYEAERERQAGDVRALRALGLDDREIAAELELPVRFVAGVASNLRMSANGTVSGDRHAPGPSAGL